MENIILEKLYESKEEKKIISVYTDESDTNRFSVGYVVALDKEYYISAMISPAGNYDGYRLALIEDIYRITSDGKYEEKIKQLYNYKEQEHNNLWLNEKNLVIDFLNFIKEKNLVITIELKRSDLNDAQGYIRNAENGYICMECIDEYGNNDGETVININNITSLVCDSEEETILKLLFEINNS